MRLPQGAERIEAIGFNLPADTAPADLKYLLDHAMVAVDVNQTEVYLCPFMFAEMTAAGYVFTVDKAASSDDELIVRIECYADYVPATVNGIVIMVAVAITGKTPSGTLTQQWIM